MHRRKALPPFTHLHPARQASPTVASNGNPPRPLTTPIQSRAWDVKQ